MTFRPSLWRVRAPELPDELVDGQPEEGSGGLRVEELRVRRAAHERLAAHAVKLAVADVGGLALSDGEVDLDARDALLSDCDLSNVQARAARLHRVELRRCRLTGFGLVEAELEHVRFAEGTLQLASFGHSRLHRVVFEGVDLREASFVGADLTQVAFEGCQLVGADFRDARLSGCAIRGSSLEGVVGISALRGVAMPMADVVGSAEVLARELGIEVEES